MNDNPNQNEIDRLRKIADFLESRPDIGRTANWGVASVTVFHDSKESLVESMRKLGGKWEKSVDAYHFTVRGYVGDIGVNMHVSRDAVCEKRVTKKTMPALPALPEREVEVVEYVCPESILQAADDARALEAA